MVLTLSTMMPLGTAAPNFDLSNRNGKPDRVRLADFAGKPLLVMFICNHCPYVLHLIDHLAASCRAWKDRGLSVVGICANDVVTHPADGPEQMSEEAHRRGFSFPYLHDADQQVAKSYGAACTPDFFLFDAGHRLVYRGQYDSTRPRQTPPQVPTGEDLKAAVEAVLAGGKAPANQFPSMGCNIKWKSGNEPDYFKS